MMTKEQLKIQFNDLSQKILLAFLSNPNILHKGEMLIPSEKNTNKMMQLINAAQAYAGAHILQNGGADIGRLFETIQNIEKSLEEEDKSE